MKPTQEEIAEVMMRIAAAQQQDPACEDLSVTLAIELAEKQVANRALLEALEKMHSAAALMKSMIVSGEDFTMPSASQVADAMVDARAALAAARGGA